jgi:hypothetical protein
MGGLNIRRFEIPLNPLIRYVQRLEAFRGIREIGRIPWSVTPASAVGSDGNGTATSRLPAALSTQPVDESRKHIRTQNRNPRGENPRSPQFPLHFRDRTLQGKPRKRLWIGAPISADSRLRPSPVARRAFPEQAVHAIPQPCKRLFIPLQSLRQHRICASDPAF